MVQQPQMSSQAFSSLSPKPTTTTQASHHITPSTMKGGPGRPPGRPVRRSDKAIHPEATNPRGVEEGKGHSPPKGSAAQLTTLVSLESSKRVTVFQSTFLLKERYGNHP